MEDFHVGDHIVSQEAIGVTADEIMAFGRLYDPQPGHISEETAQDSFFSGLAASGWHTAAITMRLLVDMGFTGVVGVNISLTWPTPTRPGDLLSLDLRVTSVRTSQSKPDRGIVEVEYDTLNQAGEVRQHTQATIMAFHRDH